MRLFALIFILGQSLLADRRCEPLPTFVETDTSVQWAGVPRIQGKAEVRGTDPLKTPISCDEVVRAGATAKWLWSRVHENRKKLDGWARWLQSPCVTDTREAIYWIRRITEMIREDEEAIRRVYPDSLQLPDRVRKISWHLQESVILPRYATHARSVKFIKGRAEIIDGGWYGKFLGETPGTWTEPDSLTADLSRHIQQLSSRGLIQSGAHLQKHWDWENSTGELGLVLELEETLSPAQACIPGQTLTAALVLKASIQTAADPPKEKSAYGAVVLAYP